MALTAEGAELTDAHRLEQIALAAQVAARSQVLWRRLSTDDISRSSRPWLATQLALVESAYTASSDMAGDYIDGYRRLESPRNSSPIRSATFDRETVSNVLMAQGPWRIKVYIGGGMTPEAAHSKVTNNLTGAVRRSVLMGGREAIDDTTADDSRAIGWRRVTDGSPCTFCAMLATRGPVYRSEETASAIAGTGLEYHNHCGCTAEIVYGEWRPTDQEQLFINTYESAAREAEAVDGRRVQETVLWRMRAAGNFRDSPKK